MTKKEYFAVCKLMRCVDVVLGNLCDSEADRNPETGKIYPDVLHLERAWNRVNGLLPQPPKRRK